MAYDINSIKMTFDKANDALSRLSSLHKQLDRITDMLHSSDTAEADRYNARLQKTSGSLFALNTLALNPAADPAEDSDFDARVDAFKADMAKHRELFALSSPLFTADGFYDESTSVVMTLSDLEARKKAISTFLKETKRLYNQHRVRADERGETPEEAHTYWVELASVKQADQTVSAWVAMLCDKPTFNQRLKELMLDNDRAVAEEKLFVEIAQRYVTQKSEAYFADLLGIDSAMYKQACALQQALSEKEALSVDEAIQVMTWMQVELDKGRRVYVAMHLKEIKDKSVSRSVSQWTTLFAVLATVGQACLSAYAVAQALGYSSTAGGLFAYLGSHPGVAAATGVIFAAVLLTNTLLYNRLVKQLLGLFAKGRMFKNADGSEKSKKEKTALRVGLSIAVITALGGAALAFNGCQAAFSAVLSSGINSAPVLALSLMIAAVTFFASSSFNFQFFYTVLSNWKHFKTQMNRLFLKGRARAAKKVLLSLCVIMTALYAIGSFMVNFTSVKKLLECFSVNTSGAITASAILNAISACYFVVAGFGSNRGLIAAFRKQLSRLSVFFKGDDKGRIAGEILARIARFPLELLFFAASVVLVACRMLLGSVKIALNLLCLLPAVIAGAINVMRGASFKKAFVRVASAPESLTQALNRKMVWWNTAFLYCVKRGGMLGVLLNAGSQAALQFNSMKAINTAVTAPTMTVGAGLSALANSSTMHGEIKDHHDATATRAHLLDSSSKTRHASGSKGFAAGFGHGFWGGFLKPTGETGVGARREGIDRAMTVEPGSVKE